MIPVLKDVIVFCKRNVYSLGLSDLDRKGCELGAKAITV